MSPEKLEVDEPVAELLNKSLKLDGFFPEFKAQHAVKLFPKSGLFSYAKGAAILSEGEPGRDLYIVRSGAVRVTRGLGSTLETLAILRAGDIFGEIALLRDGRRIASVSADEDSQIYRLAYGDIQYILKNNPDLGAHLKALAAHRVGSG